ncbi:mannan-binding lectin serine protease 1 isoform X2 [Bos indicus]|uniref:Complement C1s subcomponent n=3 Tax=Bos TaxID=9903 RepID=A0A3Q1MG08_BOVIN|nr:mannan-binding lectin serine protease 1 isoform X1 [Bos taurus]XP_015327339.1 mannan-binding lectin serine protease 1 isoform X1 [Bos taurus]XP_019813852.1 PREDICTED: mannan-binding lectin serine protease 1 isoform X2 [Bos indicus]XP_019813858.1 PREDICTED: mannan-binding lectin serine protease 1 isoform X2 [Bos indicus]XP_027394265.1 mannan-binding lectin serine protease 1 isoform X2 [Bos indicus x Bos taurus]XP_027394274.1 mannan-binding lectin serine protease 1 isoform X2 [Bos indicus x B
MRWLLLSHALCFSLLKASAHIVELNNMFGQIQSPGYPDAYPSDSEVTWNITVPEGFRIKLYFMHFNLESSYLCEYDYVKVETEDQVLATFCGRETTDTEQTPGQEVVLSPGSFMSITFRSDFSDEERFTGFDAHYVAVDVDECTEREDEELSCDHYCHNYIGGYYCSCRFGYILHTDNRTCRVECSDNLFTQRTGVITSPDFPSPYPKSSECLYTIELEEGFMISLQFEDIFDIEDHPEVSCPYDYIKIKAGPKVLGPFCGEKAPEPINTQSHSIQILFRSDNSGENRGWRLSYRATGNECPKLQPPVHGKIEPLQTTYSFKDQVLISCDTGYKVLKDNVEMDTFQMECLKDGTWSSKIPTCKIADCGAPAELENGVVTFSTRNNLTTYKSEIRYSCQRPYYKMLHNTTGVYTCSAQGVWMNEVLGRSQPTCLPVCGIPKFSRNLLARIINGRPAQKGTTPWIAMLSHLNGQPFCGGSLLGSKWIVTAAHCLHEAPDSEDVTLRDLDLLSPSAFKIIMGKLRRTQSDENEQSLRVKQVFFHPLYNPNTYENDVALLELSRGPVLNDFVMPICLPQRPPEEGAVVIVSGWGKQFLQRFPETLMEIEIPIVDHHICREAYAPLKKKVTRDMICAGEKEGGRDACAGDSGGPMVTLDTQRGQWYLVGTVSWGVDCGKKDRYGVYSYIFHNKDWIRRVTGMSN